MRSEEKILQTIRPEFLEEERKKQEEEELRRSVEELAKENSRLRSAMKDVEKVMSENEKMRRRMKEQEEEEVPRYGTPEEPPRREVTTTERPDQPEKSLDPRGGDPPVQIMLTLMQGMQEMQKRMIERGERRRSYERSGVCEGAA